MLFLRSSSSSSDAPPSGVDFCTSSGVRNFFTLRPALVAKTIISLVLARAAVGSSSLSLASSSETISYQPFFFLGVAFLIAIPFLGALLMAFGRFVGSGGRQVGQNHSPEEGGAVIWTHCQWYHVILHMGLSQRIQFSDLSGLPQMQLFSAFLSSVSEGR